MNGTESGVIHPKRNKKTVTLAQVALGCIMVKAVVRMPPGPASKRGTVVLYRIGVSA
jgi:hypothetical protein